MPTIDALLRGAPLTDQKSTRTTKSQRVCGRHRVVCVRPNVRAKLAPTVWRQGQVGENVQRTADLALVTRRWGSA